MFDRGYGGEVFWPVFARQWSRCDAAFYVNEWLINLFKKAGRRPLKYRDKFWIDLPDTIIAYRGSDRSRIVGHIAWTTVRSEAEHFATCMRSNRSHRKVEDFLRERGPRKRSGLPAENHQHRSL